MKRKRFGIRKLSQYFGALLTVAALAAPAVWAEAPRITGMAHMAYYVSNLKQARD